MPSRKKPAPSSSSRESSPALSDHDSSPSSPSPPSDIDPYHELNLPPTASSTDIRRAYHRLALQHHPDKAPSSSPALVAAAKTRFQTVAFAYAVLSDHARRARYDATGSTAESVGADEGFDWGDFFRAQRAATITAETIEEIRREYQGGEEERRDVVAAYVAAKGDVKGVFERVMCADFGRDEGRFREMVGEAVEGGVERFEEWFDERLGEGKRRKMVKRAAREEREAKELAKELGLDEKLQGGKGEDSLRALIQQRQQGRFQEAVESLEAKYGGKKQKGKRGVDEPPEEMFAKTASKRGGKADEQQTKKSKRART